jgi:hypothetical protein
MEARAEYLGRRERPRLTVVKDGGATYSALPHAVLCDARTAHGHIVTYAVLQKHWWQGGECWASHATLAAEAKCSERQLQRYLRDLVAWGFITERKRGQGQAKAYAASQHDTGVAFDTTPVSPSTANTTPVSEHPDTGVVFNTTPVSDRSKRTEEDSLKEEDKERTAANAAPPPKAEPRKRRLPDDWALTEAHYEAAAKRGLDAARAALEAEKFCDYHRARGTTMLDWLAAWRTWCGNAVTFDARRSPPPRNGTPSIPPGAASKQKSSWSDFKGRHGGNVIAKGRDDGR